MSKLDRLNPSHFFAASLVGYLWHLQQGAMVGGYLRWLSGILLAVLNFLTGLVS